MKLRLMTFVAGVSCLLNTSLLPAQSFEPAFVAYKPTVLVTPDNLPVMRWDQPGVETAIDPSELGQLELCTPGICSQEALDAGAVYYKVFGDLIAYYDQYGRLVGTSPLSTSFNIAPTDFSTQATATDPTVTPAGVPYADVLIGATPGAFEVTPAGAATYSIPIEIPPGTAGTQPQLALTYSSQGGNGLLGVGWSLAGLSAITRCPRTYAQDDVLTGLTFTSSDRFCLDGKRLNLIPGTGPYGEENSEYRTEIDTFSKVTARGQVGGGPRWFEVLTKSGEIMQYGFEPDAFINAENHAAAGAWALNRVADTIGNYFEITYTDAEAGGEYRPISINYTGNTRTGQAAYASVTFDYDSRPDPSVGYRADSRLASTVRLANIITRVGQRIVRKYHLFYDNTSADNPLSRLTHVQMCANGIAPNNITDAYVARCLPATQFTWAGYPSGFDGIKHPNHSADRDHDRTFTMDVNGDGRDDIVYENNGKWWILFAHANQGFNAAINTDVPALYDKVAVFDYNGDGLQDIAELPSSCGQQTTFDPPCAPAQVTVLKSNGTGFNRISTNIDYEGNRSFTGIRTGDLNGDGRNDLIIGEVFGNKLVIYLNRGASFTRHLTGLSADWAEGLRALEFDGDGRTDFMRLTDGTWHVLRSVGGGENFALINSGITQHALQLADVNGDGLQDAVVDSAGKFAIRLNRGGVFGGLTMTTIDTGSDAGSLNYSLVLDFNADGRQDLYAPIVGKWYVLRARPLGNGFDDFPTVLDDDGYDNSPQVGDFDGDGLVDVALDYATKWHLLFHRPGNSGHITTINAGGDRFDDRIVVEYMPLTEGPVYSLGADERINPDFPDARGIEAPLYVVSSYRRNNGVGGMREYTYSYANARINFAGRGFLGFSKQTVTDVTAGLETVTVYHQNYPYTGLVETSATRKVGDGKRVSSVINEYDKTTPTGASLYPYLTIGTQRTFDPNADLLLTTTTTTNGVPDAYGNVRNIHVQVTGDGATFTTTTVNQFDNDADNWRLGRLHTSTVTHANAAGTRTRKSSFVYHEDTKLLLQEFVQPATGHELITTYSRDDYGNITATTVSTNSGEAITPRTTATQYNGLGRYLFRVTNAEGHAESHTYDRHHGGITELIGPNGLMTSWTYDVLGRQEKEIRVDGTDTEISYAWCLTANCPSELETNAALYRKTITTSGAPTVIEYYDSLNRVVAVQQGGFNGPTRVQTVYNAKGQVWRVSRPYFDTTPTLWTEYTYDGVGRIKVEDLPGPLGSNTSDYDGFKTTLTNAKNQQTVETRNALGQTVSMLDNDDNLTRYEYDPVGNLVKVIDSELNEIVNTYNIRGHKIATDDPDMGAWMYKYNVLGELTEQTDAKGQITTFTYDKLGRMTRRAEGTEISTWAYDTAVNGKGKLAVEANASIERGYTYDSLSRPLTTTTTTTIGNAIYTSSVSYGGFSRVALMTYPTGFAVRNVYDAQGHLIRVEKADEASLVYWRLHAVNADGQITNETRDANIAVARTYNAASGRIDTIITGGGLIQDLDYVFDPIGNLESRQDNLQGLWEGFDYDDLNRVETITTHAGSGSLSKTMGYDALGNIVAKPGIGTYTYDPNRPHVLTQAGANTYTHDANGNLLAGAGKTMTWNQANLPTRIEQRNTSLSFGYGPERARFRQRATVNGQLEVTFYIGGLYEKITKGSLTTHRHSIQANGQTVALYITRNTGGSDLRYLFGDHLGSVDTITNRAGDVIVERLSYDAWGQRRPPNWDDPQGQLTSTVQDRGFTGHEHLDDVNLIHMNGRVYDPSLGRFISADPTVQYPKYSQSLNRYSYVVNNPLSYTDPSGFGFFSELLDSATRSTRSLAPWTISLPSPPPCSRSAGWRRGWRRCTSTALGLRPPTVRTLPI